MLKSTAELEQYNDNERITYLKEEWRIPQNQRIVVTGTLELRAGSHSNLVFLMNVESKHGDQIEYPVENLAINESLKQRGIFISNIGSSRDELISTLKKGGTLFVKAEVELADIDNRKERDNPLLLKINYSTTDPVIGIYSEDIIKNNKGHVLINESIYRFCLNQEHKKISEELEKIKKTESNKLELEIASLENKNIKLEKKQNTTEKNILKHEEKYQSLIEKIGQSSKEKKSLEIDLKSLKNIINKENENHMEKLERFRAYVKSQADTLLSLEFIDESEYNDILMIKEKSIDEIPPLDFIDDLNGDLSAVISHIQAYLYSRDILYPRYILEDYFALVQTNDLIILAGESGSGKTNLVKSFADAVGGKYKIIPVKPNWTSSEDLLGYYNPLEKKYLSTPFLEALLEASKEPETPYFICLDEMNLARVEYYFADFLSLLEERETATEIHLYSDDESSHVLSEFKNVLEIIEKVKEHYKKGNIINFVQLLQDKDINEELKRVFGFSDKDSLIKYHSDLRRMISGIIGIPSSIEFPKNVRLIGTINIDETTHYLSPKILDRAHIMKFDSPLLFDWEQIQHEINSEHDHDRPVQLQIENFGIKNKYPKFDTTNDFCNLIARLTKDFFTPLGVEVGLRTIRQGLNYQSKFSELNPDYDLFINNFIIHKILPKLTFDGSKMIGEIEKKDLLLSFQSLLSSEIINKKITSTEGIDALAEFEELIAKAKANDWIVNYWA